MVLIIFNDNVISWAHDRNLINGSTPQAQFLKLVEELGELQTDPVDAIGDASVVLTIICGQTGINLIDVFAEAVLPRVTFGGDATEILGRLAGDLARKRDPYESLCRVAGLIKALACERGIDMRDAFDVAWNEIKDRKGRMVDGVFVKEADLED